MADITHTSAPYFDNTANVDAGVSEEKQEHQQELHLPHHSLSFGRKLLTLVELAFTIWLIYFCFYNIWEHVNHVIHLLQGGGH